jgi:hypothetical protein
MLRTYLINWIENWKPKLLYGSPKVSGEFVILTLVKPAKDNKACIDLELKKNLFKV